MLEILVPQPCMSQGYGDWTRNLKEVVMRAFFLTVFLSFLGACGTGQQRRPNELLENREIILEMLEAAGLALADGQLEPTLNLPKLNRGLEAYGLVAKWAKFEWDGCLVPKILFETVPEGRLAFKATLPVQGEVWIEKSDPLTVHDALFRYPYGDWAANRVKICEEAGRL